MSVRLVELGNRPKPVEAIVNDVCGILAARLRNDYGGEMANWTFLGRDVTEALITRSDPS
jgi:hypothetical protein